MNQSKQQEELELAGRFLALLGHPQAQLEVGDRPDVVAIIDGHRIGIEVTEFHSDEQLGNSGSRLRAEETQKAKQAAGHPYSMWVEPKPLPGILARVADKIKRSTKYDSSQYSELWLLISSQLPILGALATTYAFLPFVDIEDLNKATHNLLTASPFSAVHLHLVMDHSLFSWSRENQWYAR